MAIRLKYRELIRRSCFGIQAFLGLFTAPGRVNFALFGTFYFVRNSGTAGEQFRAGFQAVVEAIPEAWPDPCSRWKGAYFEST